MEATDASRLVCVVVVSYQEFSLSHYSYVRNIRYIYYELSLEVLEVDILWPRWECVCVR